MVWHKLVKNRRTGDTCILYTHIDVFALGTVVQYLLIQCEWYYKTWPLKWESAVCVLDGESSVLYNKIDGLSAHFDGIEKPPISVEYFET